MMLPVTSALSDARSAHLPSEADMAEAPAVAVVVTGHVDHGKSTIVGRLLADTGSLPEGRLEQIRAYCERHARPFEHALLLDALKDERSQGITIDIARVTFRAGGRRFVIIDAPGHVEFVKNMVTGAAGADAAFVVIDGHEGIGANSRRHAYLLAMLGIRAVIVLVNKMDLVQYSRAAFERVAADYSRFLGSVGITPRHVVPVVAPSGENIVERSARLDWYHGPTALGCLTELSPRRPPSDAPLRMPVQAVYKFTERGDTRRIVAGTIESGTLRLGDRIVIHPSGKHATVRTIEAFNRRPPLQAVAGEAIGFTLEEQTYVTRGEMVTRADEPVPSVSTRLKASVFWLGRHPLVDSREYLLKVGTARVMARIVPERVIDVGSLEPPDANAGRLVERNQAAECTIELSRRVACDVSNDLLGTGRFVIVDNYEIAGGGIVRETAAISMAAAPASRRTRARPADEVERTKWLWRAVEAARRAGDVLDRSARIGGGDLAPEAIQRAAHDAHELMVSALSHQGRALPVLSELVDVPPQRLRKHWERHWLIDMADHARRRADGFPPFTVNVALIEHEVPVLGVVLSPSTRTLYFAALHLGAWRQIAGDPARRLRSVAITKAQTARIADGDSALAICYLAEGKADLYVRSSPVREWSVAAADCVFRCSGAFVPRLSPLLYNGPDLQFPGVVLGDERLRPGCEAV